MSRSEVKTAVVALGGNAISPKGEEDTIANQFHHTRQSLEAVIHLITQGYNLVITHGNGPQVGNALLRVELAADKAPVLPLGICVADVQGGMGYMIQQSLQNLLQKHGIDRNVVTLITQVIVDEDDPEIRNPSKFIGQNYDQATAEKMAKRFGWLIRRTPRGDWRRVVPSPTPLSIVESESIKELMHRGKIVIAAGGGGIPVYIMRNGNLEGFDAVVDKDLASSILACEIGAGEFFILTDVDGVAINYGTPQERWLRQLTLQEAREYRHQGHFPPGSMGPKISAAITFLQFGGGTVVIASIEKVKETLEGTAGTTIRK